MNRRGFFSFTIGAVIAGPFMRSQPVVIQRNWTLTGEEVLTPLQMGMEMAAEALKEFARQCDITSEAFRTIRKDICASPVFMDLGEDVDDDPRHCPYCGQYPCDCWRDV